MRKRREIRSYVCRNSRMTSAQQDVYARNWSQVGLPTDGVLDFSKLYKPATPIILEIGFGSGHSLQAVAKENPDKEFIGIEMHLPGIGALMLSMAREKIENIRIIYADAVNVLRNVIPDESIDVIQIFFPDPWPKRKHHKRRLIQAPFVELLNKKLRQGGLLHLATDWEHYAFQMMNVLSQSKEFENSAGVAQFSERSLQRPVMTKFEQRGQNNGRMIWELQFKKVQNNDISKY